MSKEYQAEVKYGGRKFGDFSVFGDRGVNVVNHSLRRQVFEVGFSHACPDPREVAKKLGWKWTRDRYVDCNMTLGIIVDQARKLNPELYEQLITPKKRDYHPGLHNPRSVPRSYLDQMSTGATPEGYILPRILLEAAGRKGNRKDNAKYFRAMRWADEAIVKSTTPMELVVNLAEQITKPNRDVINAVPVLAHMFANEILDEQCGVGYLKELLIMMEEKAPELAGDYHWLTSKEKHEYGMVDVEGYTKQGEVIIQNIILDPIN